MGHERLGLLPKTRQWRQVVQDIGASQLSDSDIAEVVQRTIHNVQSRLRNVQNDRGVGAAFKFLVALAVASGAPDRRPTVAQSGVRLPSDMSPLSMAKAIHDFVGKEVGSLEYARIAQSSAVDAIARWFERDKGSQIGLFELPGDSSAVWRRTGTGAGFCELARLFFASLTERYLNYFLEREASAVIPGITERERFREMLRAHVDETSKHAFETARITQSFAAGWFNRHAREGMPSDQEISSFLWIALGKIRDELSAEDAGEWKTSSNR